MPEIRRFSSRRQRLDHAFLVNRLKGAKSYRRIAGYFRSSIFELVGEELADIPCVQMVCNSDLDAADVAVSKHMRETALKERWNAAPAEVDALLHKDRYRRLHALLTSGRVEIRVVPRDRVFVHGKAGVTEAADGSKTCFLGSINETRRAFAHNYEILWEDTSPEGVQWVEEAFGALWQGAFLLPDAIVEAIKRVADRVEIRFAQVTPDALPAAALVESPIYRLQRLYSSFASGQATAAKLLRGDVLEDEDDMPALAAPLGALTPTEADHLHTIIAELARPEARDPKLAAATYFLTEHRTEGKTWREHGCIIFSQYYDTARWVAAALAQVLPDEPVAVYAGTGKSSIFRGDAWASVEREDIKKAVKQRNIRPVVATDAACEGLNLQTLGTLISNDGPVHSPAPAEPRRVRAALQGNHRPR